MTIKKIVCFFKGHDWSEERNDGRVIWSTLKLRYQEPDEEKISLPYRRCKRCHQYKVKLPNEEGVATVGRQVGWYETLIASLTWWNCLDDADRVIKIRDAYIKEMDE